MTTDELTPREREVLALAERGLTNDAIALRLSISHNAVRYHLKELHSKLGTGGERRRLAGWRRLRALFPGFGGLGAGAAAKVAVGTAMGAFTIAGAVAAVSLGGTDRTPGNVQAVDGRYPNGCPDRISAWQPTTLEGFAAEYRESLGTYEELADLNPELIGEQLPPGTEVLIAYNPNAECGEAQATPVGATEEVPQFRPSITPPLGGTAGPVTAQPTP